MRGDVGDAALVADRTTDHTSTSGVELVGADVELAVAEAVDPQHLGVDAVGLRRAAAATMPGISRSASTGGPSSARSTPLHRWAAAGANTSRPANVAPGASRWYCGVGQLDGALGAADDGDGRREQAVVRPDQHAGAAGHLDGDRPAGGADARVDDRQHDALGTYGDRPGEGQRAAADVVGPDAVGEVDRPSTCGARSRTTDLTTPTNSSSSP